MTADHVLVILLALGALALLGWGLAGTAHAPTPWHGPTADDVPPFRIVPRPPFDWRRDDPDLGA